VLRGGRSTMAVVHAENVADGAVRAATTDAAGGRVYNLANDYDVTVRQFFELAGVGLGKRIRFVPVPLPLASGVMRGLKMAARLVRGGALTVASSSSLAFLSENNPFSSDRARRELGWDPKVRPEVGIPDAFRWWREQTSAKEKGAT
jgi:nucleoside-diphosphate-sugar epimerase